MALTLRSASLHTDKVALTKRHRSVAHTVLTVVTMVLVHLV